MPHDLTITTMTVAELDMVLAWAAEEGWNPGLSDAAAFHAADPKGFFLARTGDTPVAAISVVNHDAHNAFLGLYLCRPDWRGQGIGLATWTHALRHAENRSVGLNGVPAQEGNYRASGFVRTGQSLRYVGRWPGQANKGVRDATPLDLPQLIALDGRANGYARPRFLSSWTGTNSATRATRVLIEGGEPTGFATWRACGEGTKIGPVIAPNTNAALSLIADIAALRPDGLLIIDLPEANIPLRRELTNAGFDIPFTTARMYRGAVPEQNPSLQAIATMELG